MSIYFAETGKEPFACIPDDSYWGEIRFVSRHTVRMKKLSATLAMLKSRTAHFRKSMNSKESSMTTTIPLTTGKIRTISIPFAKDAALASGKRKKEAGKGGESRQLLFFLSVTPIDHIFF